MKWIPWKDSHCSCLQSKHLKKECNARTQCILLLRCFSSVHPFWQMKIQRTPRYLRRKKIGTICSFGVFTVYLDIRLIEILPRHLRPGYIAQIASTTCARCIWDISNYHFHWWRSRKDKDELSVPLVNVFICWYKIKIEHRFPILQPLCGIRKLVAVTVTFASRCRLWYSDVIFLFWMSTPESPKTKTRLKERFTVPLSLMVLRVHVDLFARNTNIGNWPTIAVGFLTEPPFIGSGRRR